MHPRKCKNLEVGLGHAPSHALARFGAEIVIYRCGRGQNSRLPTQTGQNNGKIRVCTILQPVGMPNLPIVPQGVQIDLKVCAPGCGA